MTKLNMSKTEQDAIKQVIEKAYIQGIHTSQDEGEVKSGFHADFAMLVLQKDELEKVDVDLWLKRTRFGTGKSNTWRDCKKEQN